MIRLIAHGRSNKEIGNVLGGGKGTVKIHVKSLLEKGYYFGDIVSLFVPDKVWDE